MGRAGLRKGRYKTKNRTKYVDQLGFFESCFLIYKRGNSGKEKPCVDFRCTLEQIWTDTQAETINRHLAEATRLDEDKPGLGRHYCPTCSRYFIDSPTLVRHEKSKPHKKRLKTLNAAPPHSQEDADKAAGIARAPLLPHTPLVESMQHETESIAPPACPSLIAHPANIAYVCAE